MNTREFIDSFYNFMYDEESDIPITEALYRGMKSHEKLINKHQPRSLSYVRITESSFKTLLKDPNYQKSNPPIDGKHYFGGILLVIVPDHIPYLEYSLLMEERLHEKCNN